MHVSSTLLISMCRPPPPPSSAPQLNRSQRGLHTTCLTMCSSVLLHFLLFFFLLLYYSSLSTAQQQQQQEKLLFFNISTSPWLPTQNRVLVSANSSFAAGFRASPNSPQRYFFAIWYLNISVDTIVWSVSLDSPFDGSASLLISRSGALFLNDSSGNNLWPQSAVATTEALVLHNDGNLVYGNWSSFAFPTDTLLPNQAINGSTLTSKNHRFTFLNSTYLVFNSSSVYWTSPMQILRWGSDGGLVKADGTSYIPNDLNAERLRRLTLDEDGNLRVYSFNRQGLNNQWVVVWDAIQELCLIHGTCGPNYICMSKSPNSTLCICPPGFHKVPSTQNCELKIPVLSTSSRFLRFDYVNYSGGSNQTDLKATNFTICQSKCLANPRCLGFGFKFDGKQYCVHQIDRLLYGHWSPGTETAMFIKVSNSETDQSNFTGMASRLETTCPLRITLPLPPKESKSTTRNLSIICALFAIELISGALAFWAFLKKYIKYRDMAQTLGLELLPAGGPKRFTYDELKSATNNFSKIVGHGGFGVVYKGELPDHRVVAVKRLKAFGKGETEFWAEVRIIARMHHLNLVRMWGFCAEKSQRLLVYEYIPNGSLDKFLFPSATNNNNQNQQIVLDWNIRYRIAVGVARAVAYLHEECLEWVLHCDIKPENILLENDFCPKVSDFGLAKLAKKEDMVSMSRIRGTRGYMAPEWVTAEAITAKADVYSFGMVLLEIVSGVRSFEFREDSVGSEEWYFPRWAYEKVYEERRVEAVLDGRIVRCGSDESAMVDRMVKTAMWCLQDKAELRPSMGRVAKMLQGAVEIDDPVKPTIFFLQ